MGYGRLSLNWTKELTDKNLVEVYEYILEILKKHNIPSTFAFVGAMTETKDNFFSSNQTLNEWP